MSNASAARLDAVAPSADRRCYVIINARSGTPGKDELAEKVRTLLADRHVAAEIELVRTPADLGAAATRALESDAGIIVAGGGDGTIATIATPLLESGKALGVLPLGTFNYFAQRIGVPLDLEGAVEVLVSGTPRPVSVGDVNGRVFLNNSSIGLYPTLLRKREQTYLHIGRSQMAAYLSAAVVLLQPPSLMNLRIVADEEHLTRRTPLLYVGVNPEQLALFDIPGGECVAGDRLALYMTRELKAPGLWQLAARAFFRGLHGAAQLEVRCAREAVISLRRTRVRVALDGEIVRLSVPLRYRMRAGALSVLGPAPTR